MTSLIAGDHGDPMCRGTAYEWRYLESKAMVQRKSNHSRRARRTRSVFPFSALRDYSLSTDRQVFIRPYAQTLPPFGR